jgi:hypothetical protein
VAGLDGRVTSGVATVFEEKEPGTASMGFITMMAGLDGRSALLGFTSGMATVFANGEPGNPDLGFIREMAGLDGRKRVVGFTPMLATD